jgi:hypothetical protein
MAYTPFIPDANAWRRHFEAMARDQSVSLGGGAYAVRPLNDDAAPERSEPLKIVTPTQQVVEQAKAGIVREEKESKSEIIEGVRDPPSKRSKSKLIHNDPDIFTVTKTKKQ